MARPSMGLTKVNFYVDPTVLEGYKWLARTRGTTFSELLRIAAKQYILEEIRREQGDLTTMASVQAKASG